MAYKGKQKDDHEMVFDIRKNLELKFSHGVKWETAKIDASLRQLLQQEAQPLK